METVRQEEKESKLEGKAKGKRGFWSGFVTFLSMGGFMLILIAIAAILILISALTK